MIPIRRALLTMLSMAALAPAAAGQFRAGTALVIVDVVATRLDGNLARELTRDDFLVFEDGRPQVIRQFQVVDVEAAPAPDPPGVFSNRGEPGALFALVLDDMTIEPRHTGRMRQWAQQFLDEQVRPGDYVGVMRSGADSPLLLTTDRDLVRPVIAQASGRRDATDLSSLTGISGATVPMAGGGADPQMPDFSALGLTQGTPGRIPSLVMLQRVVEYLAPIPARRKAVLFFSQGVPFDLEAFSSNSESSEFETPRQVLAAAREGNVAIYTMDPRGLEGVQDAMLGATPSPSAADGGIDSLRDLANATGGRAVVSSNELRAGLERISRENRFYYLLGYEPADTNASRTRARQIEVRTRAPGVTLLHRRAYAPSSAASLAAAAPRSILAAPLPVADLAITLAPVMFPDSSGGASLAVPFEIGGKLPRGGSVKYTIVAVNGRGLPSAPVSGSLRVTDGLAKGMVRQKLAPGRYQLRLQVEADGVSGVTFANVHIPAPNSDAPACGGFMLLQPEGGSPRPNVTRRLVRTRPVMMAMVLSAKATLAKSAVALVARRPGGEPDAEIPVARPQRIADGLWRLESGIPASTFIGDVELMLLVDEQPVAGCRAELHFE